MSNRNKYYKIYKFHGGGLNGIKRAFDTFYEIDLFDIMRRGVVTNKIKTEGWNNKQYMFYSPAYSSVVLEMLRLGCNYYTSAIRYTDFSRKAIFIDLGCGAGKTILQALETRYFNYCCGVELDPELVTLSKKI